MVMLMNVCVCVYIRVYEVLFYLEKQSRKHVIPYINAKSKKIPYFLKDNCTLKTRTSNVSFLKFF